MATTDKIDLEAIEHLMALNVAIREAAKVIQARTSDRYVHTETALIVRSTNLATGRLAGWHRKVKRRKGGTR